MNGRVLRRFVITGALVSLGSIITIHLAIAQEPSKALISHDTSVSLDLVIAAVTLFVAIGGMIYTIRGLNQRMDCAERDLRALNVETTKHMSNPVIHGNSSEFVTHGHCMQEHGELLIRVKEYNDGSLRAVQGLVDSVNSSLQRNYDAIKSLKDKMG